jgi:Spy/CpxP family protein refolding chaperone
MKKLLILFFVSLSLALFAQQDDRLTKELGLSPEQKTKIDKIMLDGRTKSEELRIQIDIKKLEVRKLLLKEESIDKNQLQKAYEEESALRVQLNMLRYEQDKQVFALLTTEQVQKFKLIHQFRDKGKKGKAPFGHPGGENGMMGFDNPGANCDMPPMNIKNDNAKRDMPPAKKDVNKK